MVQELITIDEDQLRKNSGIHLYARYNLEDMFRYEKLLIKFIQNENKSDKDKERAKEYFMEDMVAFINSIQCEKERR